MQAPELDPVTQLPPIPAMTSQAERDCYYRLAKEADGAVIEFGAWMGASTAYIAAAMRDSGKGKAHTYDKFQVKKSHVKKVREFHAKRGENKPALQDASVALRENLGPLLDHVEVHHGKIEQAKWESEPIGFIMFDAPKRVPAISAALTNFRKGIRKGTMLAWQDFCHFPSYEIPASLYRLRDHIEFTEAVVPGSTMVFRVTKPWGEVTRASLEGWTPDEVALAWRYWDDFVPDEKFNLFMCGQAMFLSDLGYHKEAVAALKAVLAAGDAEVLKKWRYLRGARPDFVVRYRLLFDCVPA